MREHVVASSKAMKRGDWKKCKDYMLAVKVRVLGAFCVISKLSGIEARSSSSLLMFPVGDSVDFAISHRSYF